MLYKSDISVAGKVLRSAIFTVRDRSLEITHTGIPALSLNAGQVVKVEIVALMPYEAVRVLAVHENTVSLDLWPDPPKRKRVRKRIIGI